VCFFSAAFAAMFSCHFVRGSVTVPSSAKRPAERDSSQQHAAQQRDAGSTTLNCLVDLDRLEPHPVQAQLVQDQAAASGGCGAAAGWLAALSEPPERLLDRPSGQALCARLTRTHAIERFTGVQSPRGPGKRAVHSTKRPEQQPRIRVQRHFHPLEQFETATRGIL